VCANQRHRKKDAQFSLRVFPRGANRSKKGKTFKQAKERLSSIQYCMRCGWREEPGILHHHHVDRDRSNNEDGNVEKLCPNCHFMDHYRAGDLRRNLNGGKH
jgi:hypothetical protein